MAAKGISYEIHEIVQNVKKTGMPSLMQIEPFLRHFSVDPKEKTVEDIERIQNWLLSRKVVVEPEISASPPNAVISIKPKPSDFNRNEAHEKLQLLALPCAHMGRENLPIVSSTEWTLNKMASLMIERNESALLLIEDETGKPKGVIDAVSFARHIESNDTNSSLEQLIRPIFFCANSTDSLIETIDKMIKEDKPHLIITNDEGHIVGFTDLHGIFREFFPISRPFFMISKIEGMLTEVLINLGFGDDDYLESIEGEQREARLKGGRPGPHILTMGEKVKLLSKGKLAALSCDTVTKEMITAGIKFLNAATSSRNNILHFRSLKPSEKDLQNLNEAISVLNHLKRITSNS